MTQKIESKKRWRSLKNLIDKPWLLGNGQRLSSILDIANAKDLPIYIYEN
jgi:hypothetical protein